MLKALMITNTGYLALAVLLISVFFTFKISKRLKDSGCLSIGFTFVLFLSTIAIFISTAYMSLSSSYIYWSGDKYSAKIISYKTYEERYKDSDNRSRTRTMHIPLFEFKDKHGKQIKLESSTHSGEVPNVGENMSVSYLDGSENVLENTFGTYFLIIIAFVFAVIFGFLTTALVSYSFGNQMTRFKDIFAKAFLAGLPISMILLFFGLTYGLYNHIVNGVKMPIWALFFVSLSMLSILGILYILYVRKNE